MKNESVRVAVRVSDGTVAFMEFLTRGRGSVLPDGASWVEGQLGLWERPPTDANLFSEIMRAFPGVTDQGAPLPTALGYRVIDAAQIPADRTFRDALVDDGEKIVHDMPKARELLRDALRAQRAPMLARLDTEYLRADEAKDSAEKERIAAAKQALRDVTDDPRIEAAETVEELKAIKL